MPRQRPRISCAPSAGPDAEGPDREQVVSRGEYRLVQRRLGADSQQLNAGQAFDQQLAGKRATDGLHLDACTTKQVSGIGMHVLQ
jgi:hypothetical protein